MSNLVPYGSYDQETARQERRDLDQESAGEFREIKPGKHVLRVLPPSVGKTSPFQIVHLHYIRIPGQQKPIVVTCPRMATRGKRSCAVCAKAEELRSKANLMDRDMGFDMLPKRKVYMQVIDRKNPEAGVQIQPITKTVHDKLVEYREDPDDPCDFSDPLEGYDIMISRVGTSKEDTKYSLRLAPKMSPLHKDVDQMNAWLSTMKDLGRYATLPSDEEVLKALQGKRVDRKQLASGDGGNGQSNRRAKDDAVDADFTEDSDPFADGDDDLPDGF